MISVVMTNWQKAYRIEDAIGSLEIQTVKPSEVLFVDDASTDNSLEIIKQLRERVAFPIRIFETHESLTHNICLPANIGFKRAKADIIVISPSDIIHVNCKNLEKIQKWHETANLFVTPKLWNAGHIQEQSIAGLSAKKELIYEIKGYDERMYGWGDNDPDIFYRLQLAGGKWVRDEEIIVFHLNRHRPETKRELGYSGKIHRQNFEQEEYCPNQEWGEHSKLEEIL